MGSGVRALPESIRGIIVRQQRALILDPSGHYRLRVAAVLEEHPAVTVVGAVGSAEVALRRIQRHAPDLLVLEDNLDDLDGLQTVRSLLKERPELAIWILTEQGSPLSPRAKAAFSIGVRAWFNKPDKGLDALRKLLHRAVDQMLAGEAARSKKGAAVPRRVMLPTRGRVSPNTARVRRSYPAPPAEPMQVETPAPKAVDDRMQTEQPDTYLEVTSVEGSVGKDAQMDTHETAAVPVRSAERAERAVRSPRTAESVSLPRAARALPPEPRRPDIVVLGASQGGPEAIAEILAALPADFPLPVVVVQPLPRYFARRLAARLDAQGPLRCAIVRNGAAITAGRVWMAPGESHLEISGGPGTYKARIRRGRRVQGARPSVDVLLSSLCRSDAGAVQVVVLTGAGQDGADGARALLAHGGHVIAQDEETSVVWGMPSVVVEAGTAHATLPVETIAGAICRRL